MKVGYFRCSLPSLCSSLQPRYSSLCYISYNYITLHYIQKHQRWVCLHDRSHFYNRCCFPVSKCFVIFFTVYNKLEIQPNLTANFSIWHDILSKLFSCLSTTILEDILWSRKAVHWMVKTVMVYKVKTW